MLLRILHHDFHYEMENLCRVFFPRERITAVKTQEGEEALCVTTVLHDSSPPTVSVTAQIDGREAARTLPVPETAEGFRAESERAMAQALFAVLAELTGYLPDWGILTGVRPSKLMRRLTVQQGEAGAAEYFREKLFVQPEKIALAQTVSREEESIIAPSRPESFSLYAAVPFCPSRCSYCSFVSHSITGRNAKKLIPQYVERLCEELAATGDIARTLGLRCESVYFGGGTPTVLDAEALAQICQSVQAHFDLGFLREYTVEAGRPDTVTREKLETLRRFGVDRVSVNPQSFDDAVLRQIGRGHTAQDAVDIYRLARDCGFSVINMDLIAGLPGDSAEGFAQSAARAIALEPENITVHTLALKRAARLNTERGEPEPEAAAAEMLHSAQTQLTAAGYRPYYMYRQSRCVGNLENVGWCKGDTACAYNVYMMEECHSVLAAGAGAVTKLKAPQSDYLERIFNFKFPYEYNARFAEMLLRKERIRQFYREYHQSY